MTLTDLSVHDLLSAFSSSDPTPGGGSASALGSALGASLLLMVSALPKTRSGAPEERAALDAVSPTLTALRDALTRAVDEDSAAYDRVVAAYKLPKATPDDQQTRKAAIQDALRAATDVPLDVMRLSLEVLDAAATIARHGHRGAASDVGVALGLLRAGHEGARLNALINIEGVKDAAYVAGVRERIAQSASRAEASAAATAQLLESPQS